MSFNATTHQNAYRPRDGIDADHDIYQARLKVCTACPLRHAQDCTVVDQLCSVLARPVNATCPNRSWPGDPSMPPARVKTAIPPSGALLPVAVVIACHNYGRFLADAVESVLAQTLKPTEIVIVEDTCTDDSADVASRYVSLGVKRIPINSGNTLAARRAGFNATAAPVLCFLDADDMLPPNYLESCLPAFRDPNIGVVTTDLEKFGTSTGNIHFLSNEIEVQNFAHAGSLVRRAALETSGAIDGTVRVGQESHADWFTWRRVARVGWKFTHASGTRYLYRQHGRSQGDGMRADYKSHFDVAALRHETITLFIRLSGRTWAWPATAEFLEAQTWPHDQIRLVLCDTSDKTEFNYGLRDWLDNCSYSDYRLYRQTVGAPGLQDQDRSAEHVKAAVQAAMPRIYNRAIREATTEYVWIVEDDILPPADAAEKLMRRFHRQVASVSGAYVSRSKQEFAAWDRAGEHFAPVGNLPAASEVGGNGFGCVILRRSVASQAVIQHASPTEDCDANFYHWLASTGHWRAMVVWGVRCEHRGAPLG